MFTNTIVAVASWLSVKTPRRGDLLNDLNFKDQFQRLANRDKYLAESLMPATIPIQVVGQAKTSQYDAPSAIYWSDDFTSGWSSIGGVDNCVSCAYLLCPFAIPNGKTIYSVNAVVSSASTYTQTPANKLVVELYRKGITTSVAGMSQIYTGTDPATFSGTPNMTTNRIVTATVPNTFHVVDSINYQYLVRVSAEYGTGARSGMRLHALYASVSAEGT